MQIVSTCLARDLSVYKITFQSLRQHFPNEEVHLVTRKQDFHRFHNACGDALHLWDEAELLPSMTLDNLRQIPLPFFPKGAGWYFQQFLKYAFVNVSNEDDHFLIWDADTILLRPLEVFDQEGRPIYTKASEQHLPYFDTFEAIFGVKAQREFSFISQHQVINKDILRAMLNEIENRHPEEKGWPWAIMKNLRGEGSNLFSEYETYGHYLKLRHPGTFQVRDLEWTRKGGGIAGSQPNLKTLTKLSKKFSFAAFEASDRPLRKLWRSGKNFLNRNKSQ